jgi:hypothetical protein
VPRWRSSLLLTGRSRSAVVPGSNLIAVFITVSAPPWATTDVCVKWWFYVAIPWATVGVSAGYVLQLILGKLNRIGKYLLHVYSITRRTAQGGPNMQEGPASLS